MSQVKLNIPDFLSVVRLGTFVQTLASKYELSRPLTFLNRTAVVNKIDELDILNSYSGSIFAADLITNDAEAVVVDSGRLETVARMREVPNIKIGQSIGQSQLSKLQALRQQIQLDGPDLITGFELNLATTLITGVRQRMNQLCAAMALDGISYDRLGVKVNSGFGTPSVLKQTIVGTRQWTMDNLTTMKPIEDLQYMAQSVAPLLGKSYDRVTMATTTFRLITQSDEFSERVRLRFQLLPTQFELNPYDVANNQALFEQITGMVLELEDATIRTRNTDGTETGQVRVLPANQVILSNTNDDNDESAYFFGNTIVDETVVAQYVDDAARQFNGPAVGPVAYYWIDPSLNPPRLNAYAVAKGWPVKVDKFAHAILTVA